jgi:hypothetical protein
MLVYQRVLIQRLRLQTLQNNVQNINMFKVNIPLLKHEGIELAIFPGMVQQKPQRFGGGNTFHFRFSLKSSGRARNEAISSRIHGRLDNPIPILNAKNLTLGEGMGFLHATVVPETKAADEL